MLRHLGYKRYLIVLGACVLLLGIMVPLATFAKSHPATPTANTRHTFEAIPFEFDPGKTMIVEAAWGRQQGLPDAKGTANYALLLTKIGITSTNAASGATITNVKGITLTELGFDVRADGHCGAGAPRFDVVTSDGIDHFAGCAAAITAPAGTDPQGNVWLRKRFDLTSTSTNVFPPFTPGTTVKSIAVIFDEGTDNGQGYTFLDNIDINGVLIGQPS